VALLPVELVVVGFVLVLELVVPPVPVVPPPVPVEFPPEEQATPSSTASERRGNER
jgi:hypothetical protein